MHERKTSDAKFFSDNLFLLPEPNQPAFENSLSEPPEVAVVASMLNAILDREGYMTACSIQNKNGLGINFFPSGPTIAFGGEQFQYESISFSTMTLKRVGPAGLTVCGCWVVTI